jgi:hypothetical protein
MCPFGESVKQNMSALVVCSLWLEVGPDCDKDGTETSGGGIRDLTACALPHAA